jgi:FkbM family methyltransferase
MATAIAANSTEIVRAVHPHWHGRLALKPDGRARHVEAGNTGWYGRTDGHLTIIWDNHPPESFTCDGDVYRRDGTTLEAWPTFGSQGPVALRVGSSDAYVFHQIFVEREYDSPDLPSMADTIVDLGANGGLASLFFAERYPAACLLAVEPDAGNFALLAANLAPLGKRATAMRAAVWPSDGHINLHHEDDGGTPLGDWGIQVSDHASTRSALVPCDNVATLLDRAGFDRVDILKVDIEGAELEVFSERSAEWLPRIGLVAIETHDRFRPGSEAAVRNALAPFFEELPPRGENLFFRAHRP